MRPAAAQARAAGRRRRRPALPGLVGRWFLGIMEPPVRRRLRVRAPALIRPRLGPPLHQALAAFRLSQEEVRAFVREVADLDLASVRFVNPFHHVVRFSLATGIHVIAAHERRHLWQAWNVRRAMDHRAAA
jgi:hypothetical protein